MVNTVFISIGRMPFLAPTLNNANPLYDLVMTQGLYLHHLEVADQDSASCSLWADKLFIIIIVLDHYFIFSILDVNLLCRFA